MGDLWAPLIFTLVPLVRLAAALLACEAPAGRAASLDHAQTLRSE